MWRRSSTQMWAQTSASCLTGAIYVLGAEVCAHIRAKSSQHLWHATMGMQMWGRSSTQASVEISRSRMKRAAQLQCWHAKNGHANVVKILHANVGADFSIKIDKGLTVAVLERQNLHEDPPRKCGRRLRDWQGLDGCHVGTRKWARKRGEDPLRKWSRASAPRLNRAFTAVVLAAQANKYEGYLLGAAQLGSKIVTYCACWMWCG